MKKTSEQLVSPWNQISFLIGFTGMAVSTVFLKGGTDPFNLPKMALLTISGLALLFLLLNESLVSKRLFSKQINILICVIMLGLFNSFFLSGAPTSQQFFGVYGRNTGLLTSLMLLILFCVSTRLHTEQQFRQIPKFLFIAGALNIFVCILELFKINPQGVGATYSYGLIGTFGNPNFISSFFALFSVLLLSITFSNRSRRKFRVTSSILSLVVFFLVLKTESKQGLIVIVFGGAIVLWLYLHFKYRSRLLDFLQFLFYSSLGILGMLGTLQKGPLEGILYKQSVSYRGEYWAAGLNMFKSHVLHGVGLNSYGDWYRVSRRPSSLISPGEGITTNTSHNVFIDYAATGGIILLLGYLSLIALTLVSSIRMLRRLQDFDFIFVSVFVCWLAYLLQSIISIDQIGLAVWGWILPGILIAMDKSGYLQAPKKYSPIELSRQIQPELMPESSRIRIVNRSPIFISTGVLLGVLLVLPALRADFSWRAAQNSTSANRLIDSGKSWPINEFKLSRIVIALYESNLNNQALELVRIGNKEFPRSSGMWQFLYYMPGSTQIEKNLAIRKIQELDPNNGNFKNIRNQGD